MDQKIVIVHPDDVTKKALGAINSMKLQLPCPNADVAVYGKTKFEKLGLNNAETIAKCGIGHIIVVSLTIEDGIGWANELRKATGLPVVPVVLYRLNDTWSGEPTAPSIMEWNIRWVVYEDHPFIPADQRAAAHARLAKHPSLAKMNGQVNNGTDLPTEFMWHKRTETPWTAYNSERPKVNKRPLTAAERENIAGQSMKVVAPVPAKQKSGDKPKPKRNRQRKSAFVPTE